jgi:adenylylsulfate kinase
MTENIVWHQHTVNKKTRAASLGQKPSVIWLTGLSGSGKSTLANLLERKLHEQSHHTYLLDGDNVRHGLCGDLGFDDKARVENNRRFCRSLLEQGEFVEVFVDTPIEVCEQRDPKGLYKKARQGDIKHFTGIDSAYEVPESAEIHLSYKDEAPEETAERLYNMLKEKGYVS